jgi:hypothetical protein
MAGVKRVQDIERAVQDLSDSELREFREWFAEFDARMWDAELEQDVSSGLLDNLADEAISDRDEGRTRSL